jgi:O-antigen ligase
MIFMTIGYNLSSYSIGALILFFLVDKKLIQKIRSIDFKFYAPFLCYFLLLLIGMIYTEDQKFGWRIVSLSVSIFLIPLVILSEKITSKQLLKLLIYYKYWLILLALYLIVHKLFIAKGPLWTLTMFSLETQIGIHQLYFSQFYLIGVLIGFKQLFNNETHRLLRGLEILFFIFFIVVLGSFTAVLITMAIAFVLSLRLIRDKTIQFKSIFIGVFILGSVALSQTTIVKTKLQKLSTIEFNFKENLEQHKELKNYFGRVNTINLRMIKWYSASNIITSNFLGGVGTGDGINALVEEYKKLNFKNGIDFKYNAHNQYLETTIKFGIIGLVSIILLLYNPLRAAVKQKNFMLLSVTVFLIGAFCFESMLERQHGVVFLSFFIPLLYVFNKE